LTDCFQKPECQTFVVADDRVGELLPGVQPDDLVEFGGLNFDQNEEEFELLLSLQTHPALGVVTKLINVARRDHKEVDQKDDEVVGLGGGPEGKLLRVEPQLDVQTREVNFGLVGLGFHRRKVGVGRLLWFKREFCAFLTRAAKAVFLSTL